MIRFLFLADIFFSGYFESAIKVTTFLPSFCHFADHISDPFDFTSWHNLLVEFCSKGRPVDATFCHARAKSSRYLICIILYQTHFLQVHIAFWFFFTWHTQVIIWETFKFLEYFLNMFPSFHEHFILIYIAIMNYLFLLLEKIHVFFLFEFISLSVFVIRVLHLWYNLVSVTYSVMNIIQIFLSVLHLKKNPFLCLH